MKTKKYQVEQVKRSENNDANRNVTQRANYVSYKIDRESILEDALLS